MLSLKSAAVYLREIPRPAGENAGLRDDAAGAALKIFKLSHYRSRRSLAYARKTVEPAK